MGEGPGLVRLRRDLIEDQAAGLVDADAALDQILGKPRSRFIPRRLSADLVEAAVVTELRRVMRAPSITAQVIAHLAREGHAFAEADVISALQTFDDVWGQLFPAEQTRIVQLLVRRVTVTSEGLVIDVRTDGVSGVMRDMMAPRKKVAAE